MPETAGYAPSFTQLQASQALYGDTPLAYSIPVVAQLNLSKARARHKIYFYLEALETDPTFANIPTVIAFSLSFTRSSQPVFAIPIVLEGTNSNAGQPLASIGALQMSAPSTTGGISIIWANLYPDVYQPIQPDQQIFLLPAFEANFNADQLTVSLVEAVNINGWKLWVGILSN